MRKCAAKAFLFKEPSQQFSEDEISDCQMFQFRRTLLHSNKCSEMQSQLASIAESKESSRIGSLESMSLSMICEQDQQFEEVCKKLLQINMDQYNDLQVKEESESI